MGTLKTVQKIFKVLKVFAQIGLIFSIIGAVGCLIGGSVLLAVSRGILDFDMSLIARFTPDTDWFSGSITMFADMVMCIGGAIVCSCTNSYLKNEIEDGTPFSNRGAKELLHLGIKTIVYPLGATIIASGICAYSGAEEEFTSDMKAGIAMILLSFVFRYGAELEERLGVRHYDDTNEIKVNYSQNGDKML